MSGFSYFAQGWRLISRPGIRRFVILPLLVNILLMGGAFWWLFNRIGDWVPQLMSYIPSWLQWLSYLLWPLMVISLLLVFSYLFSTLANIIAAPFNGLLAEQLEASLTGKPLPDTGSWGIVKDLPRIMAREWRKLAYYLPRALVLLLLYFVPGVGQQWHQYYGSCSVLGCYQSNTVTILLITIKSVSNRCALRCVRIKSITCNSVLW